MKTLCLVALIMLVPFTLFAQAAHHRDTVTKIRTTNGNSFWGTIEKETEDTLYFRTGDGIAMQLPRTSIAAIDYKSLKPRTHWSEFGGVLGTPAGLNFVVGARWPWIGVRLSAAYWGESLWGVQIGAPLALWQSEETWHGVGVVLGKSHLMRTRTYDSPYGPFELDEPQNWMYGGAAYELNTHGFSLELGITVGQGDFTNPQAVLQIGYVHQNK